MFPENFSGVPGLGKLFDKYWRDLILPWDYKVEVPQGRLLIPGWDPNPLYLAREVNFNDGYRPGRDIGEPGGILDLGANIGTFTLWAAANWVRAHIVSVEIDSRNFSYLQRNVALNGLGDRVTPVWAAVYSEDGEVGMFPGNHSGNRRVNPKGRGIPSMSLRSTVDKLQDPKSLFMKSDIEGGEERILTLENEDLIAGLVAFAFVESHGPRHGGTDMHAAPKYFEKLGFKVEFTPTPFPDALMVQAYNPQLLGRDI